MFKNVASQKIAIYAYDSTTGAPKTGDAANITAYINKDGAGAVQTNDVNPTEQDATNMKGIYEFDTTQAETNADLITLSAVSGTANIRIEPVIIYTQTVMRGTDSAALASVCTEGRLAELDAANLPADLDAVLADTNELQTDWADGGRLDLLLDAIPVFADVVGASADTYQTVLKNINSMAKGNFYKAGGVYTFYDDDDTGTADGTLLFTNTVDSAKRLGS